VLSEADLKPHADAFIGVVNDFLHLTRHAIYFTDTVFSVKVRLLSLSRSSLGLALTRFVARVPRLP
jgi:hypothetical protein